MLSVEKCKELLCKNGKTYTDEQIIAIRDFCYKLAVIEYEEYLNTIHNEKASDNLHKGFYRRAS